jgi:hypothetical protein
MLRDEEHVHAVEHAQVDCLLSRGELRGRATTVGRSRSHARGMMPGPGQAAHMASV